MINEQHIISTANNSPTVVSPRRDGDGVVIFQGRNRVYLSAAEVTNLVAALGCTTTTPAKARLIRSTAPSA
jgi:hypothetical protein